MIKNIRKIIYLVLISLMMCSCFSCKKKPKHKWIEVGVKEDQRKIKPGIQLDRGTESDAVPVDLISVYTPLGCDKEGIPQYKKILYEVEKLTPENVDLALKELGIISEESVFFDVVIKESNEVQNAGPGSNAAQLTKKGTVRYYDLGSPIDNSDDYEGKYYGKDIEGLIDQTAVMHCITETFSENFQLVSCDIEPVTDEEYKKSLKK